MMTPGTPITPLLPDIAPPTPLSAEGYSDDGAQGVRFGLDDIARDLLHRLFVSKNAEHGRSSVLAQMRLAGSSRHDVVIELELLSPDDGAVDTVVLTITRDEGYPEPTR